MNVQRQPTALIGNRPSERETEAALAKFEQLTERQQAIVFDHLLRGRIEHLWGRAQMLSEYHTHGITQNPLGYGPKADDALGVLVNAWLRKVEQTGFRKTPEHVERDRAEFFARQQRSSEGGAL